VPPVGTGGAFTYEALIKVSTISAGIQQIFAMEGNGGAAERPFQFRVSPGELQFVNIAGASGVDGDNNATIPTTGPDAFVPNEWFHVAVTYDGNENTADNLKLYWTRVDAARTEANLIGSFTLVDDLTTANTTVYSVGNDGRTGGAVDKNIEGLVDEVRISGTARSANQFIFFDPADAVPPQLVSVNPPDDSTGVWAGTNLVATFDEPVEAGSDGVIEIRRTSDNVTVESFDVTSSPRLSFGGTSVTGRSDRRPFPGSRVPCFDRQHRRHRSARQRVRRDRRPRGVEFHHRRHPAGRERHGPHGRGHGGLAAYRP
jgi:hypothetical protein